MREFQNMLEETIEVIRIEMEKGKDVATMQEEQILNKWEKYAKNEYTTTGAWIQNVVNGFNDVKMGPTPQAHYYNAFTNDGVDAVFKAYNYIKNNHADEYQLHPAQLYKFAYFMLDKEKYSDAIRIFEFNISENPDSYYLYDGLGEAYWRSGDDKKAIKFYQKSLELEPANSNATMMMELINKE